MGCDLEWATGSSVGAAVADPPVFAAGAAADRAHCSARPVGPVV